MPDEHRTATSRELFMTSFVQGATRTVLSWALPRLASAMRDIELEPGEELYRAGEAATRFYFIDRGDVRVESADRPKRVFHDRSVLGVRDAMLARPRARTATAETRVHALEMPFGAWLETLRASTDLALGVMRATSRAADHVKKAALQSGSLAPRHVEHPPAVPRVDAPMVEHLLALRGAASLRKATTQALADLAALAVEVRLEPDEPVPAHDTDTPVLWIVARGTIEAARKDTGHVEHLTKGDFVRDLAAFLDDVDVTARAVTAATLLRIDRDAWFDVQEEHFDLTFSLLTWIEERADALDALPNAKAVPRALAQ